MPSKRRIGPRPIHIADGLSELMAVNEVAMALTCTTQTVNNLRKSGALPYVPVGRWMMYRRQDVAAIAAERRRSPPRMLTKRVRGIA